MTTNLSTQVAELGREFVDFSGVDCIPPEIRELLADPSKFGDPRVIKFTTGNSTIARILHENPASDAMLRIVYPDVNGHPLTEGLDRFLSRSLSGQALRDRLDVCSRWLAKNFVKEDSRVVDLGGGSGSYAFEALRIKRNIPSGFVWDVVDLDAEAVDLVLTKASEMSLGQIIQARQKNFMKENKEVPPADYAVLIGVLCGMDTAAATRCLERVKLHLKEEGEILAATLLKTAFREDPRTFRVLCNVGGWQLRPKEVEDVRHVFEAAGWDVIDLFGERPGGGGQYAIVHAKVK